MGNVDKTLDGRGNEHGKFESHAAISQRLKGVMHKTIGFMDLPYDMQEALDMIQHKIARVLNGNPEHIDSWHDIQGYARLVERRLIKEKEDANS